jgi:peptidoglycan/xylan/chitin deacetylase (PgdA/CDA1 family)
VIGTMMTNSIVRIVTPLRQVKRRIRRWRTKFHRRGLILVYHRIATLNSDPWGTCVQEKNFIEQMRVIKEQADPIPLRAMVNARSDADLPDRPVSITFDDGYVDNFETAAPLLDRFAIPATMFLTTGYFSATREYWWDELDRLVLGRGPRPEMLTIESKGRNHRWKCESCTTCPSQSHGDSLWRAWEPAVEPRQSLYQSLYDFLVSLPLEEKYSVLDQVRDWAGTATELRSTYRTMSEAEVRELSTSRFIEIGAHTVTHPVLSAVSRGEQQSEIASSKAALERITGNPVTSFAYPYGKRFHYSKATTSLVRDCGFVCGCSNFWGVVTTCTTRFELPRIQALDWGGDKFAGELDLWFQG